MLIAYRVSAGSTPPATLRCFDDDGIGPLFSPSPSYTAELQRLVPAPAGPQWFGYLSSTFTSTAALNQGTIITRFGLPVPAGGHSARHDRRPRRLHRRAERVCGGHPRLGRDPGVGDDRGIRPRHRPRRGPPGQRPGHPHRDGRLRRPDRAGTVTVVSPGAGGGGPGGGAAGLPSLTAKVAPKSITRTRRAVPAVATATLSEPGTVHMAVARAAVGRRRANGVCAAPTRALIRNGARRCTRFLPVATITGSGLAAGARKIPFSGRGRAAGTYRLTLTLRATAR